MIGLEYNSILELTQAFPDEKSCIEYLEVLRWNGHVVSPFDKDSTVYKCKGNKYHCKNTDKKFNVKTGTLFDNTKIGLQKWFIAIWLITSHKKGISSLQLARDINVTQKTAWFMLQRIRACLGFDNDNDLDGDVEVDETNVGGKNKNRHADKKVEQSQGRSTKDKTPVVGMIERNGKLNARTVNNVQSQTLTSEIVKSVKETATLYTDEWVGYRGVSKIYDHFVVDHNQGEYVNGTPTQTPLRAFGLYSSAVYLACITPYPRNTSKSI